MSNSGGDEERARLEAEVKGRNDFTLQAMHQQFERWTLQFQEMRDMIIEQNDTIAAIRRENNVVPPNNVRPQVRRNVPHIPFVNPEYDNDDFDVEFNLERRDRRGQRGRVEDDNINSIKMKMPSFKGTRDPDLYLDWERRVEAIFDCHNYSEGKKVKLAVVEFSDYAASWWKKLARDRLQEELPPIATWAEMKRVMRKRFIPSYFQRDLQSRLQRLKQGSMSVDEYFKSMDMAMIQANCMEEEEATIARFLNGLNTEIANVVEIQQYVTLDELVDLSVKVEKQIEKKQQNNSWRSRPNTISKKPWSTQEGKAPSKPQDDRGKGNKSRGPQYEIHRNINPRADMMKKIHEQTRLAIEKKNKEVALRRNKGRKYVVFKPGDLVWVHMRKERFPSKRKTKLDPRGSGPYKVLERIGDNAYKLDLPGEFQVSATFNVSDLSHFDADLNSRTNSLQEEGNDSIQGSSTPLKDKDEALETPRRPITRSQTKEFNDKLNGLQSLIQRCLIGEEELKPKGEELSKCYNYLVAQIQAQDEEF
ncbi:hypothetical protein KY290_005168 [Solanum tuberosum]|uniref:Retrotransposon gag domain-containing protein n=1 Tax=Solanum tuberosum TaxID=4113 RepID=A0ABQ7WEQ9_SOLTU|nr:hypothetical protein KY290_005168 [Solanum tuberosum]